MRSYLREHFFPGSSTAEIILGSIFKHRFLPLHLLVPLTATTLPFPAPFFFYCFYRFSLHSSDLFFFSLSSPCYYPILNLWYSSQPNEPLKIMVPLFGSDLLFSQFKSAHPLQLHLSSVTFSPPTYLWRNRNKLKSNLNYCVFGDMTTEWFREVGKGNLLPRGSCTTGAKC